MPNGDRLAKLRRLRQDSDASLQACKRALEAAGGDEESALRLLERDKIEEVRRRGGCSEEVAIAALEHARGALERAVEIAKAPRVHAEPELVRATKRARVALGEKRGANGLYELRDVLPHAKEGRARRNLELVLEFHSIMASCDAETFLENEDNEPAGTQVALAEIGATSLARYLELALEGPRHMEARARLERELFQEELPLLVAVLDYIEKNTNALS